MTGMYRLMLVAAAALWAATSPRAAGPDGEVTAVSLAPAAGKTEIVVNVRGAVDVRDFLLDLARPAGARRGRRRARRPPPPTLYDGVKRGGVVNLRYSQFRPDMVRIVVDLEGPQTYDVDRSRATPFE